jgi:methanogenic corrinoid protein MtbC1
MTGNMVEQLLVLEEEKVLADIRESLEKKEDPLALVEALRGGMTLVGKRFEDKEYFLSELIMSAEIFKEAIALIEPHLGSDVGPSKGKVVVGTVKGDIHDIGKNIVVTLLRCDGFEVYDLGVDVPPEVFVSKLEETGATLLGLSGLLTLAFDSMKKTVDSLAEAGMRNKVKVIIGGGPVNEKVVEFAGADAYGIDAAHAVKLAVQHVMA